MFVAEEAFVVSQIHELSRLRAKDFPTEPLKVALAVERHRWAWRPSKVRFILLAESHVFTDEHDLQTKIIRGRLPPRWRKLPDAYVRLVYCLGYGENNLLTRNLGNRNSGTRQYWDIFGRLAGTGCQPRGGARVYDSRLEWKFRTLTRLRDRGIWLLDSSLHALVARGSKRHSDAVARELHGVWWNE